MQYVAPSVCMGDSSCVELPVHLGDQVRQFALPFLRMFLPLLFVFVVSLLCSSATGWLLPPVVRLAVL